MSAEILFAPGKRGKVIVVFLIFLAITLGAVVVASLVQQDYGQVEVVNVTFENDNAIPVRAKLFKPLAATDENPSPGVVYVHGYQNNRETSDPYCIELARRGFVVLNIDALGRGNSGNPGNINDRDFDHSYGSIRSINYLRNLSYVNASAIGVMGHSLGAEMVYYAALDDPDINAIAFSGFGYTMEADFNSPRNMMMIYGKYDEYRSRMTETKDFSKEWMSSPQTRQAIDHPDPDFAVTYGKFANGTARRVFMPPITHVQQSHDRDCIAEAVVWMKEALKPPENSWFDPNSQIWPLKEWATLIAMLACFASIFPLSLLLLQTNFFSPLQNPAKGRVGQPGDNLRGILINGILAFLYLPLVMVLFAIHLYLVPIDKAFPMMMVNGIVWWFLVTNIIGFFIFRRWYKKESARSGLTLQQLGLSDDPDRFKLEISTIARTILLASFLFAFAYIVEHLLESIFIIDFRFIFPFASDLTPYRVGMFFTYLPFVAVGFILMGLFLHGRLAWQTKDNWLKTFLSWTAVNISAVVLPLVILLLIQYVPIFTLGFIPFFGPGGVMATFMINLMHIILKLLIVIPIMTWLYMLTGKIYAGSLLAALLVTWMFASSQVIAPIPV